MEFPEVLYVRERPYECYPLSDPPIHLVGEKNIDLQVPDNNKETIVAIYQLVRVDKYQKLTTRTSVVKRVQGENNEENSKKHSSIFTFSR